MWRLSAFLLLAVGVLYGHDLSNPLVFDDNLTLDGVTPLLYGRRFTPWDLRWLPYATFGWTQMAFGFDMAWYRIGNLALHAINSILLMVFLHRLFALVLKQEQPNHLSFTASAFFGALLFALHPVGVYAVAYLNQRTILMATTFALLCWIAVLSAIAHHRPLRYWLAVLCYFFAVFSKEHAVMVPAVALALIILARKSGHPWWRDLKPVHLLFILVGVVVFLRIRAEGIIGHAYQTNGVGLIAADLHTSSATKSHLPYLLSVVTQSLLFFKYWLLWLLPNPAWMSIDMFEPFATSLRAWPYPAAFAAFVLYGLLGGLLLFRGGAKGVMGLALLAPWLLFATELSTVRIQEPFVLYRSYLWMIIPVGCMPLLLCRLPYRRAAVYLALACLVMIPLGMNRLHTFRHALLIWNDAVILAEEKPQLPLVERLYNNRGIAWYSLKKYPQALADFNRAIMLNGHFYMAYANRGATYFQEGQYDRALADNNVSLRLNPSFGQAWLNRGHALVALQHYPEALVSFKNACQFGQRMACQWTSLNVLRPGQVGKIVEVR